MAFRWYERYHSVVPIGRRKFVLASIIAVGLTCLGLVLVKGPAYRLKLRTYLRQAQGLRSGTPVSVDGVRVGAVRSVDVRPELGDHPVEAVIAIGTPYKLVVPKDSVVWLAIEGGVLGQTVLEIDTRNAVAPPIENDGVLKSVEVKDNQAAHALEFIGNALIDESKNIREKDKPPNQPSETGR